VHLGDFIDRDFDSFDVVGSIYGRLEFAKYHVLGNHDFSVADEKKKDVPQKLGLSSRYYDFAVKGWRFVVLDGNDISFHAHPKNSPEHQQAVDYYERNKIDSPDWNGAVGPKQVSWLEKVLEQATHNGEQVVIYCHFPVYPKNVHNLWNAQEVIDVIERFPCVKAYLNGHNHAGNYGVKKGVHYLTFKGMVDTAETSYATVTVREDRLEVAGYGREPNRVLEISR
jgi:manganese-dependent ADP-ribose/CDP-alcohol diphosphatase